jgi:hypothetical protein
LAFTVTPGRIVQDRCTSVETANAQLSASVNVPSTWTVGPSAPPRRAVPSAENPVSSMVTARLNRVT